MTEKERLNLERLIKISSAINNLEEAKFNVVRRLPSLILNTFDSIMDNLSDNHPFTEERKSKIKIKVNWSHVKNVGLKLVDKSFIDKLK
jgi:hypothetical protein